ncbi:MAG: energy-coupling factor transporter ATPase [Clostridiales bacterium]|jgi:energy-coupling factor transport system ATP-binding protein|nr:energy-coupling factor transporter ATPase [Clostridiales bacterium]
MEYIVKAEGLVFEYQAPPVAEDLKKPGKKAEKIEIEVEIEAPPAATPALDGVDMGIKQGEFVAVLGHNGSGKSTLAKHINCLLMPTSGTVWVKGIATSDEEKIWDIRQSVGMVFQNPDNQIIATIVEEDVAFGPENLGIEPAEIRRRVDESLATVGMSEFAGHPPHHLSGGQKQRVAIAGILAMRPDIIVLDEATAMLDPIGRREVMKVAKQLNEQENITIILITHYMDEAALADRIVVMSEGKVVMSGAPGEVFTHIDTLQGIGLDVPQAAEIAHKLRLAGVALPDGIVTGAQLVEALWQSK